MEIYLEMAQVYYDKAMKEDSSALTPVYMLSLYGKWQKLDIGDTMKKFFSSNSSSPRSQMVIILAVLSYCLTVFGMVKFLRRDYRRNH